VKHMQVPQLDAATDPLRPLHVGLLAKWIIGLRKTEIP
jgi:hypothetical protein